MATEPIILLGAGGHARACIDVIEQQAKFSIAGLVGRLEDVGTQVLGYPVIGTDADLPVLLAGGNNNVLIAVGQIMTPDTRIRLYNMVVENGASLPTVVSPQAYVSRHAKVGQGTIIMHGAVVNAEATIGRNCIINSQALVEHDVVIEDHCHVSTGTAINSCVRIGAGTFIGSNTSVRQCISIGENCMIGMGQRVISDCESGTRIPPANVKT
jgi:sugar O-acyltransferase (sialic acid O-acetyltransferase NeuD family)